MAQYTIGIDFGSLSARGVLVDIADGHIASAAQMVYPHGVMEHQLPNGFKLPPDWALQHPQDYLDALTHILSKLVSNISAEEVIGLGIDFTSSTVLPTDDCGTPLCFKESFQQNPYAYVMMWKHHGAIAQAQRMTQTALERNESWLQRYGGIINAEWLFPKLLQILEEASDVYHSMAHFVEAGEWLTWQLTGQLTRSACCVGYKAFYTGQYPDKAYFAAVHPAFENVVSEKLSGPILPTGSCAGVLTPAAADRYGLKAGIPVAVSSIDAHACLPGMGIDCPGKLLAIIGTSTCHIVMSEKALPVPGMSGVVDGGVLPGYAAYEAGQSCSGDLFHWFEHMLVNYELQMEAQELQVPVQTLLTEKASRLLPGESGLLALDWWNGNRSTLADADLTGMILGMTLQTRPEEIYRALIEATAFGARVILEAYRSSGVPINAFYAGGGVAQKNRLAMQIYADVLGMPVHIAGADQTPALGSAIYAAASAGVYPDAASAVRAMSGKPGSVCMPIDDNIPVYERLYQEYKRLHDYFGRGENNVLKRLKALRKSL